MSRAEVIKKAFIIVAAVLSFTLSDSSRANYSAAQPNGATLFRDKCAICHGKDGRGLQNWRSKGQPDLASPKWQKSRTDAQIAEAIKEGKGRFMPAWKNKLSDEEINALVKHTRALVKK
ncbi:MAG: c-type cytochrome [Acidobacteriota bacterium]